MNSLPQAGENDIHNQQPTPRAPFNHPPTNAMNTSTETPLDDVAVLTCDQAGLGLSTILYMGYSHILMVPIQVWVPL